MISILRKSMGWMYG